MAAGNHWHVEAATGFEPGCNAHTPLLLMCAPVPCRARSQRLLESTWDDLLARQAAEAQAAEAFAAWLAPAAPRSPPASPVAQGP